MVAAAGSSRPKPPVEGTGDFDSPAWIVANAKAYWRMEEDGGDRADTTGNGNTLTSVTVDPGLQAGKVGGAANFSDGAYLSRPSTADLQIGAGDFIVAAWVKPATLTFQNPIVQKGSTGDGVGYQLRVGPTGAATFTVFGSGEQVEGDPVNIGEWSFIAALRSAASGLLYIKVNNGAVVTALNPTAPTDETLSFYVGANLDEPVYYDGLIDEVLIAKPATPLSSEDFNALTVYLWGGGAGVDLSVLF
jgi:hypothetical protein